MSLNGQEFTVPHLSPSALSSLVFVRVPAEPWSLLAPTLSKHTKMRNVPPYLLLLGTDWPQWDTFLSDLTEHFPLIVQLPQQILCLSLLTPLSVKENPFTVWFWDTCRFLWSEHSPDRDSLSFFHIKPLSLSPDLFLLDIRLLSLSFIIHKEERELKITSTGLFQSVDL
jgi:hypothetical protein